MKVDTYARNYQQIDVAIPCESDATVKYSKFIEKLVQLDN